MLQLGRCYETGTGVPANQDTAFDWYWQVARMDNAEGCYRLGLMLLQGRGCTQNKGKAVKWFKKAAEKNHARAQQKLDGMNQSN
jgi:TPR repeat protein